MPFDLGDDAARFRPASGLIGEVRIRSAHVIGRAPSWPLKEITDPCLQNAVGRQTDHIFDPLGFERGIDVRAGEARVASEIDA